jgi:tripartite-type tricarboxylate transporter receptor subunit TctC
MHRNEEEHAMKLTPWALAAVAAIGLVQTTAAQAPYPTKPVRIVVPYAPGGAVDVVTRKVAQKLTEQMGQSFYVENKAGATGSIGTQLVARATPDGYTLLANDNTYSILPYVFKELPWDHASAFAPITVSVFTPVLVAVPAASPFKTLGELLAHAKAHPDTLNYGTGGQGSAPHFATEAFQLAAGVKLSHIPYKGAGEAMLGLVGNQIDLLLVSTPSAVSQIKSGKIRALAVSGDKRLEAHPDIPTFAEAGLPGFGVVNWSGLAAPAGTPADIVARLNGEVKKALASPDMQEFIASMSAQPGGIEPAAFSALIKDETARWAPVAEKAAVERQ